MQRYELYYSKKTKKLREHIKKWSNLYPELSEALPIISENSDSFVANYTDNIQI